MSNVLAGIGEIPEELKNIPTCSPSRLFTFMKSPKHYKHEYIDGNKKETDAMLEGRMVHMYLLEPDKFTQDYVNPFKDQAPLKTVDDLKTWLNERGLDSKGCKKKEDYERLVLFNDSKAPVYSYILQNLEKEKKTIITPEEIAMLEEIKKECDQHEWLSKALRGGTYEQLMWFFDEHTEMIWRFKPDYFHQSLGKYKVPCVLDFKKMPSTNPEDFNAWLYKSRAFVQLAIYKEGLKKIFGVDSSVVVGAYDTAPPQAVEAFEIDGGAIDAGLAMMKKKGLEFLQCHKENKWPTHGRGKLLSGTLPTWAFNRIDFEEDMALEA